MKKILFFIIFIFTIFVASAQNWKTIDTSNEWQQESAEQYNFAITTFNGYHIFVYPERNMMVIAPSNGKVTSMKYEPVSTKIRIRYYNEMGIQVKSKKEKMLYNQNGTMGIIMSKELIDYLQNSNGFVRIRHYGQYGFRVEIPTFSCLNSDNYD